MHHTWGWSGAQLWASGGRRPGRWPQPPPLSCRKRPGRTVYAQMHNEKEQEMTSPVSHSQGAQSPIQGEGFIDGDLDSQTLGNARPENPPPHPPQPPPSQPPRRAQCTGPRARQGVVVVPPSDKVMTGALGCPGTVRTRGHWHITSSGPRRPGPALRGWGRTDGGLRSTGEPAVLRMSGASPQSTPQHSQTSCSLEVTISWPSHTRT